MSRTLPTEDPSRLGPFELTGRLTETPAGIVYRGTDPHGREITLAVLNQGAADDAAARDRFRAAILAEPLDRAPPDGATAIVGAEPAGPAPWVATLHEPGSRGAERFLAPVLLDGPPPGAGRSRAPLFQPYWLGSRDPALTRIGSLRDLVRDRSIASTVLAVAALLVAIAVLLLVLYACRPATDQQQLPTPSPTPTSGTPTPTPTPTSGTPTPTRSGTPPPTPSDGGGQGAGGDA
ncbi:MAG TPA: hypothetical protein VH912_11015 [Streptosporangiaceae bacterium]|jgi:hypothetical protein